MANPYQSPSTDSEPGGAAEPWLACPWCGEQAMSSSQKARFGPLRSTSCSACGKSIGVGSRDFLLHFFMPTLLGWAVGSIPLAAWLGWLYLSIDQPYNAARLECQQQWSQAIVLACVGLQFAGMILGFFWSLRRVMRDVTFTKR